jgi:NAD(P)-dependent dehydrogenase (short-subunit alcohol dehydrogenase family)
MTKRLDGTVALVNGASSGIGEATGCALAAQGATLARPRGGKTGLTTWPHPPARRRSNALSQNLAASTLDYQVIGVWKRDCWCPNTAMRHRRPCVVPAVT